MFHGVPDRGTPYHRRPASLGALAVAVVTVAAGLSGCQSESAARPPPVAAVAFEPAPPFDAQAEPAQAVLSLVPQSVDILTVTDWDLLRAQLGQPDLTSEGLRSDRKEFWRRADAEGALLNDGLLREDDSRFELDYGFTQDDVDWEAHWTGTDGLGFVLGLRPDLELGGVRRAIADRIGSLAGAELRAEDHLVVLGTADAQVWATEETWAPLVYEPATASYLHRGCIPLDEALGAEADEEDRAAVLASHPVATLDELPGFVVAYDDHHVTVSVEPGRGDLFERIDIGEDWPVAGFSTAYVNGAADPSSGRLGFAVPRPTAATGLALLRELPFAVCPEGANLSDS